MSIERTERRSTLVSEWPELLPGQIVTMYVIPVRRCWLMSVNVEPGTHVNWVSVARYGWRPGDLILLRPGQQIAAEVQNVSDTPLVARATFEVDEPTDDDMWHLREQKEGRLPDFGPVPPR